MNFETLVQPKSHTVQIDGKPVTIHVTSTTLEDERVLVSVIVEGLDVPPLHVSTPPNCFANRGAVAHFNALLEMRIAGTTEAELRSWLDFDATFWNDGFSRVSREDRH